MFFNFFNKPRILFYADSPSSELIGKQYKKYLTQYTIDIITSQDWIDKLKDYDIFCHTNMNLLLWKVNDLQDFVEEQHKNGTKVVLFERTSSFIGIDFFKPLDAVFVSDQEIYNIFIKENFQKCYLIQDGIDLSAFGPDVPFQKRQFRIVSRKSDFTWQKIKKHVDFVEIFDRHPNPEYLNKIYNECTVFYGKTGIMEAAACGLIPILKNEKSPFQNSFEFDNDEDLLNKIEFLKNDQETLLISRRISKEVLSLDYRLISKQLGKQFQSIVLKKKALNLA